jgi:hypothetical protein
MKFLKATVVKTWTYRIKNTYISGDLKMEEIQNQIKESKLRWSGHVKRMDKHRIPKRLPQIKTSEKRPRGRPRT